MGCVGSIEDRTKTKISLEIDNQLKNSLNKNVKKLLILGIGGSGKSTILKQLRIMNNKEFSTQELINFKEQVLTNLKVAIDELILSLRKAAFLKEETHLETLEMLENIKDTSEINFDDQTLTAVDYLISLPIVKQHIYYVHTSEMSESTPYFLENIKRITEKDYLPNNDDIVRVRNQTTGITETCIEYKDVIFKLFDVGGQRSERKKWINCFDEVDAVIYVIALSDYNRFLTEDLTTNCMNETLKLLGALSNSPYLRTLPFIILLNKEDVFSEKIAQIPLTVSFPEYSGDCSKTSAIHHIKMQAVSKVNKQGEDRNIYVYVTCATNSKMLQFFTDACYDNLVRQHIADIGFS